MAMLCKMLLAGIWLLLMPAAAGITLLYKKDSAALSESLAAGYLIMLSVMELLALPMIYLKLSLHVLTASYGIIIVAIALAGLLCLRKRNKTSGKNFSEIHAGIFAKIKKTSVWLWLAVIMIFLQMAAVSLFAHFDADDAMYVGAASTAIQTDTIFSISPYTGIEYETLPSRYVLSPFPVFLAVISKLCMGLHPAIMAHMIFPPVFLILVYVVQNLLAKKWFPKDRDAQGMYLSFTAVLCWFSAYSVYNAGNFQMVRIWQGKALLASAMLPMIIYLCLSLMLQETQEYSWSVLFLANLSCCLISSMGIMLSALLTGIITLVSMVYRKKLSFLYKAVLCCIPSLMLGIIYIGIK